MCGRSSAYIAVMTLIILTTLYLSNPNQIVYSVLRDTLYTRNKFAPQPYVRNELNLKQRVETKLPSDEVVDMVKEQPYWKRNMVRPSTWHTPSTLVTGPDPILGSFDARCAHGAPSNVQNFKEQNTDNNSTDINVKEHTSQVTTSSHLWSFPLRRLRIRR
jgi:hypothetical protein